MAVTERKLVICFFLIKSKGGNDMTLYLKNAEIGWYNIIFDNKLNEE